MIVLLAQLSNIVGIQGQLKVTQTQMDSSLMVTTMKTLEISTQFLRMDVFVQLVSTALKVYPMIAQKESSATMSF